MKKTILKYLGIMFFSLGLSINTVLAENGPNYAPTDTIFNLGEVPDIDIKGIKIGMTIKEVAMLYPGIIINGSYFDASNDGDYFPSNPSNKKYAGDSTTKSIHIKNISQLAPGIKNGWREFTGNIAIKTSNSYETIRLTFTSDGRVKGISYNRTLHNIEVDIKDLAEKLLNRYIKKFNDNKYTVIQGSIYVYEKRFSNPHISFEIGLNGQPISSAANETATYKLQYSYQPDETGNLQALYDYRAQRNNTTKSKIDL